MVIKLSSEFTWTPTTTLADLENFATESMSAGISGASIIRPVLRIKRGGNQRDPIETPELVSLRAGDR